MALMRLKQARLEVRAIAAPKGAADHAPLVFLHEGLGSVALWQTRDGFWPEQVCAATGRAGWVYSRPGYGASDPIADVRGTGRHAPTYMHEHALQTLPELLDALPLKGEPAPILVGHSDGGTIALIHAAHHRLSGCVVMAPHVMVEDISIRAIEAAKEAYEHGPLRERLMRFHSDVDNAFWQWNDVWLSPAFRSFDIRTLCRDIRCPVLALQGVDDPYGTLRQIEEIAPSGPIERVVIPSCGHSPHRDQPEATLAAIRAFLADLP
jgi:pimeloyl-ACP methyl ester carboxylesterase